MTQDQLRQQMIDARQAVVDAAEQVRKAFEEEFKGHALPSFDQVSGDYVWADINWNDEDQVAQTEWLEKAGLTPIDCAWLWGQ